MAQSFKITLNIFLPNRIECFARRRMRCTWAGDARRWGGERWTVEATIIMDPRRQRFQRRTRGDTLWLCQHSYWKWPFIVDVPIKTGGSFH